MIKKSKYHYFHIDDLEVFCRTVHSWDQWLKIKNSGRWNPEYINADFYCNKPLLKSLEGSPETVTGTFNFQATSIKSLIGSPRFVGKDFFGTVHNITSLEGAPDYVGGDFIFKNWHIDSLEGIGIKYLKECNSIVMTHSSIKSNVLGLLMVKKLFIIPDIFKDSGVYDIIKKHYNSDKDVLACQEELISLGFKKYAKL